MDKLTQAIQYADMGYKVFPCVPNDKRPATAHGCKDATTEESQILTWWEENPDYNIGVATDGLLVVDIDGADNDWMAEADWKSSLISITPRGGKHIIYRQPHDVEYRNTASTLAPSVDTRANGGYILVQPSTVNDRPYRWAEGYDIEQADQLTEPPEWMQVLLARNGGQERKVTVENKIPNGQRNAKLTSIAGTMRRTGLNEDEINQALLTINKNRCSPPLSRKEIERISWSVSRYEPDQAQEIIHFGLDFDEVEKPRNTIHNPGKMPASYLKVPGLIGDIIQHNLKTSFKPQPELALAAAIALMGTITGRKVKDYRDTRTNIYCLGVCDSGGGKEHARKLNKDILFRAGGDELVGPEGFASHAGIVSAVDIQPSLLFQLDEIGRLIKTLNAPGQSPHLYHISTILMKMYTSSNTIYTGDAYADTKMTKKIYQPSPCIYGTTVPQSLYEGLSAESVTDGFLSRMMIFEASNHDPEPVDADCVPVPESILTQVKWWLDFKPGGNLSSQNPQPVLVNYTDEAMEIMRELEATCREEKTKINGALGSLWTRTTEKAHKLALIYACSQNGLSPEITQEAAKWAVKLSKHLSRKMVYIASQWISESPYERKKKRLLREVEKAGLGGMSKTDMNRRLNHLTAKERNEIISDLIATGYLFTRSVKTRTNTKTLYTTHSDENNTVSPI